MQKLTYRLVSYIDETPNAIVDDSNIKNILMLSQGGIIWKCSRAYDSIEELKEKEKVLEKPCIVCGGVVGTNYTDNAKMIERNMCFSCDHWTDMLDRKDILIINGVVYTDGGNRPNYKYPAALGFGGHIFRILKDNKEITTNNLWQGGMVPKRFLDKFPDNAKFIKD